MSSEPDVVSVCLTLCPWCNRKNSSSLILCPECEALARALRQRRGLPVREALS
jgi:hypothetical protein